MPNRPIQKIIFGSPGTGKSYRVENKIIPDELKITDQSNIILTVFHPEYTYGDFMGKLMPLTDDSGKVEYKYYSGHFLKALAKAYQNIITSCIKFEKDKKEVTEEYKKEIGKTRQEDFSTEERSILEQKHSKIIKKPENVVLVIDEINRGNSAAIFGTVFQLLDRKKNGWSQYPITISDLETIGLLQAIGFKKYFLSKEKGYSFEYDGTSCNEHEYNKYLDYIFRDLSEEKVRLQECKIKLPPNLSLLATMNTSDNSIYFMDSAFKRRWDWEFLNIEDDNQRNVVSSRGIKLYNNHICAWNDFVDKLNEFIRSHYKTVRKIEDKQIGYFFINEQTITEEHIKNKLMFFIWDSVFSNNRKPLTELLQMEERDLVTFGQFTQKYIVQKFVKKIIEFVNV
jgi:5-methylcytosine-specific restriction protein B